ncbi:MAG TPA: Crp/Fnr family transcriptional regulator [Pyrinomonadaceae bacterium]|jgi:CRP-like cAMP-binding protein
MSSLRPIYSRSGNRLLAALPPADYERLQPALEPVRLAKGQVLYLLGDTVNYCYFPFGGVISILSATESGDTVEVAMIGSEGMAGVPSILQVGSAPYQVMVQIEADGLRIRAEPLAREFNRGGALHSLLLRYTHGLLCQIAQSAVCNRFHTVKQRLCRWLLITRDRVRADAFPLTQEYIAHMLGVPRTNVTMTASALQRERLIRYTRGRINIIDHQGLERAACECYRLLKTEVDKHLAA